MTRQFKNIIFDLDGTLSDSKNGILNSLIYSLENMKIKVPAQEKLISFIGIPLQELFSMHFNLKNSEVDKAVFFFREYYSQKGVFENELFPGIEPLLKSLSLDCSLFIATSKLEKFAVFVLNNCKVDTYFKGITGADAKGFEADKTLLVKKVIEKYKIKVNGNSVMVGDTFMDIDAAKACGIKSVGVTYGYGSREKIIDSKPDFIAETVGELSEILG